MTYNIEELLKQLTDELVDYINDKKYVYKTCGSHIVVLEKLPDTITNENRSNVSQIGDNKLYAQYRANKLMVKKIINKYDLTKCANVVSNWRENKTEYKINENVYPNNFDADLENVCSNGIHYFLKLERAFYYYLIMEIENGEHLSWHENGQIYEKYNYVNGKLNGEYLEWYDNGEICQKCNYVDGKLNGEYLDWYENGQMCIKCNYIAECKNGEYLKWYKNGQLNAKFNYIDDKLNEENLQWYKNGQMKIKCNFVNGKLNGEYLEWYENGKISEKCNYVNEKLNGEYLEWYKNGQIKIKGHYVNGIVKGEYFKSV